MDYMIKRTYHIKKNVNSLPLKRIVNTKKKAGAVIGSYSLWMGAATAACFNCHKSTELFTTQRLLTARIQGSINLSRSGITVLKTENKIILYLKNKLQQCSSTGARSENKCHSTVNYVFSATQTELQLRERPGTAYQGGKLSPATSQMLVKYKSG